MKATTINMSTFTLSGPGATAVAGAVTYSGTTATFTPPTSALAASTLYTATITTGSNKSRWNRLGKQFFCVDLHDGNDPGSRLRDSSGTASSMYRVWNQKIIADVQRGHELRKTIINAAGTFTVAVAGVGGAAVPGTVTYVAAADTATCFAPTAGQFAAAAVAVHRHASHGGAKRSRQRHGEQLCLEFYNGHGR